MYAASRTASRRGSSTVRFLLSRLEEPRTWKASLILYTLIISSTFINRWCVISISLDVMSSLTYFYIIFVLCINVFPFFLCSHHFFILSLWCLVWFHNNISNTSSTSLCFVISTITRNPLSCYLLRPVWVWMCYSDHYEVWIFIAHLNRI